MRCVSCLLLFGYVGFVACCLLVCLVDVDLVCLWCLFIVVVCVLCCLALYFALFVVYCCLLVGQFVACWLLFVVSTWVWYYCCGLFVLWVWVC